MMPSIEEKDAAVHYIKEHQLDKNLQLMLNDLFRAQPTSVYGFLSEELAKFADKPILKLISGYNIKSFHDNNNRVSVEICCEVKNTTEAVGTACCGCESKESCASLDDLKEINDGLQGLCVFDQADVDAKLKLMEVSKDLRLTVSLAALKSHSKLLKLPIHAALQKLSLAQSPARMKLPLPFVNVLNGGKNGPGKNNIGSLAICADIKSQFEDGMKMVDTVYDKVEEILRKKTPNNTPCVSPNGGFTIATDKVEQLFEVVKEALLELEIGPDSESLRFVLDCSASEFHTEVVPGQGSAKKGQVQSASRHRYDWVEGQVKATEDWCDYLESLVENENIVALIDPLHHEDTEGYERLTKSIGSRCLLFSRNPNPLAGPILKLNTTVTDTVSSLSHPSSTILEAAAYEEGETVLADLALASGCAFTMFGGLRGVRSALYNRLRRLAGECEQPAASEWGFRVGPIGEDTEPEEAAVKD